MADVGGVPRRDPTIPDMSGFISSRGALVDTELVGTVRVLPDIPAFTFHPSLLRYALGAVGPTGDAGKLVCSNDGKGEGVITGDRHRTKLLYQFFATSVGSRSPVGGYTTYTTLYFTITIMGVSASRGAAGVHTFRRGCFPIMGVSWCVVGWLLLGWVLG